MTEAASDWLIYDADGEWVGIVLGSLVAAVWLLGAAVTYRLAPGLLARLGLEPDDDRPARVLAHLLAHAALMILLPLPLALASAIALAVLVSALLA